jgi:hypothetical protein
MDMATAARQAPTSSHRCSGSLQRENEMKRRRRKWLVLFSAPTATAGKQGDVLSLHSTRGWVLVNCLAFSSLENRPSSFLLRATYPRLLGN